MAKKISKELLSWKMLLILILGFSSGLPLALTGSTLKTWLAREGVNIKTIGYFSWVGLAYSLKFVWSPLLDRYQISRLGRRRSWMILSQLGIISILTLLGTLSAQADLGLIAALAVVLAFFSATQDIAIDAFRRELLTDGELGIGSSLNIYGYRIAMLVSGGLGIGLVGSSWINLSWGQLYWVMAGIAGIGVVAALLAKEPTGDFMTPKTLKEALVSPLAEFFKRQGALLIVSFVILYKLGDALAVSLLNPFYVEMGFSNADIALIAKTYGLASSLAGSFLGGLAIFYWGIRRCLWIFGIAQTVSTASFSLLVWLGPSIPLFASVVIFEDVATSMATTAFVAFIASMSNKRYTATQYAALSSLATLGRNFFSGFTGTAVASVGWAGFFVGCAALAIPGLIVLAFIKETEPTTASE